MPNWVSIKIEFEAVKEVANTIYGAICVNDRVDFNTLIPTPLHIYQGNLGSEDEKDFGDNTWSEWNRDCWGTKWNACNPDKLKWEDGKASIEFDTAWSVPYSVIVAFGNKFLIPFTLKYFDEGHNFWGIEEYVPNDTKTSIRRKVKKGSLEEERRSLHIELRGYDYEEDKE
jgi:hypothetical protein